MTVRAVALVMCVTAAVLAGCTTPGAAPHPPTTKSTKEHRAASRPEDRDEEAVLAAVRQLDLCALLEKAGLPAAARPVARQPFECRLTGTADYTTVTVVGIDHRTRVESAARTIGGAKAYARQGRACDVDLLPSDEPKPPRKTAIGGTRVQIYDQEENCPIYWRRRPFDSRYAHFGAKLLPVADADGSSRCVFVEPERQLQLTFSASPGKVTNESDGTPVAVSGHPGYVTDSTFALASGGRSAAFAGPVATWSVSAPSPFSARGHRADLLLVSQVGLGRSK
jgi:hypothetical protein